MTPQVQVRSDPPACLGARHGRSHRFSRLGTQMQQGAAAVEFALVTGLCIVLLLAGIEVGRLLFAWNAAVEATRLGARLAVVCGSDALVITRRMQRFLPSLEARQVVIENLGPSGNADGCDPGDCHAVRVALQGGSHATWVPGLAQTVPMPPMQTTLRKEFMNPQDNEVCR